MTIVFGVSSNTVCRVGGEEMSVAEMGGAKSVQKKCAEVRISPQKLREIERKVRKKSVQECVRIAPLQPHQRKLFFLFFGTINRNFSKSKILAVGW